MTTDGVELQLSSVNVGRPSVLGMRQGKRVRSAIRKQPVMADELDLDALNLAGDKQADLRVHGGPDKAVYAYPTEHLDSWQVELGVPTGIGFFGENLSTSGATERDVRLGDVWAWGEARLQISQPRSPCFKLALRAERPDIVARMIASGRTGWYLRVLQPGRVPTRGPLRLVERDPRAASVLETHRAAFADDASVDLVRRALASPGLANGWRARLRSRLDALGR